MMRVDNGPACVEIVGKYMPSELVDYIALSKYSIRLGKEVVLYMGLIL
jgi:hypothetical protein